jgi:transposase
MDMRYRVTLEDYERLQLVSMVLRGKATTRKLKRARILLAAAAGSTDAQIGRALVVGTSTVFRARQRFVEEGLERALNEAPRTGAERNFDASYEAVLIALVCSKPPNGCARWTLRLLADEMSRLTSLESISDETIRQQLKALDLKPWHERMSMIPKVDDMLITRMEDVLRLCAERSDALRPALHFFDERTGKLRGEAHRPDPAETGPALVVSLTASTTESQASSTSPKHRDTPR